MNIVESLPIGVVRQIVDAYNKGVYALTRVNEVYGVDVVAKVINFFIWDCDNLTQRNKVKESFDGLRMLENKENEKSR